jgi:hypothetical protein
MQFQSIAELEQTVLQLPLQTRIALLQTLALSLSKPIKRRTPPAELAGKIKELGDIIETIPETDWNSL